MQQTNRNNRSDSMALILDLCRSAGRFLVVLLLVNTVCLPASFQAQEKSGQAVQLPDQSQSQSADNAAAPDTAIGIAPVRFELPMKPGTERTVVVNIIHNLNSVEGEPCRLVATLEDWRILKNGDVDFSPAKSQPDSAAPWIIYSPTEVTVQPGRVHPIRVTISVPKEAAPGDRLAALVVQSRPGSLKLGENKRQVVLNFRMAALFYVMVVPVSHKGTVTNLTAHSTPDSVIVTPTLINEGNSHVRPVQSITVNTADGAVVAQLPEQEAMPVLAGGELSRPIEMRTTLPPGDYLVRYRVDFRNGGPVIEAQTSLKVGQPMQTGKAPEAGKRAAEGKD
ncbi:MAG TPA: hypothetical protein VFV34_23650 [Blastocatellia bacterium]|nr:hypothetical protein [Blastocatellia bacterium]